MDSGALETSLADLQKAGIPAIAEYCDVTSPESLQALADAAHNEFGGVDLVFANAGIAAGEAGSIWEYSPKDWHWCMNVNLWGAINTVNVFMPILVAQNREAHMVITGSGNGALLIYPDTPIYTVTKAAVHALTENLYYQTRETPIQVHALFPGPHVVDTGLFNSGRVRPAELQKDVVGNESGISSVEDMKKMAAEFGIDLKTTHPDEVAETAVKGIENNQFWILNTTPGHGRKNTPTLRDDSQPHQSAT